MRYQSFNLRLARLREAAQNFGWHEVLLGASAQGRPIVGFIQEGGGQRILAWSLMHGNEPTGYEAILAFMRRPKYESSYFLLPILNPDGAEAFTRFNGEGVDVNRDARAQESAEARALVMAAKRFHPHIALNLHDQRPRFYPEAGSMPATFSLLAPKGHPDVPTPAQRQAQIKAQSILARWTQLLLPSWEGGLSRFDDQYYPTAFGEFFQEQGIATMTIETGISLGDWSRAEAATQLTHLLTDLDAWQEEAVMDPGPYLALPMNASPANEWVIHHANGVLHLRLHEQVAAGVYSCHWMVDTWLDQGPTWMESRTTHAFGSPPVGEVFTTEVLQAAGLVPDLGLKI